MTPTGPASRIPCPSFFDGDAHRPEGGVLVIQDGIIVAIEPLEARPPSTFYWCPGWVNAHAHLELSALQGLLPQKAAFPEWVSALQCHTRIWNAEEFTRSYADGLRQAWAYGTTTLYDVGNAGVVSAAVPGQPHLWAMREVLGLSPPTQEYTTPVVPHALYSTHPKRIAQAVASCQQSNIPWSVHLAESLAEQEILTEGTGPFRPWLDARVPGHPFTGNGEKPLARWLRALDSAALGHTQGFVIHGNYLDAEELRTVAKRKWPLVHCPQSRAWFGHAAPDWTIWKSSGVDLCVGTDSLASAHSLDPRAQLRTLRTLAPHAFSPEELLRSITATPGKYLGGTGRIALQAPADLVCLRLPAGVSLERIPEAALDETTTVHSVWVDGIETLFDKDF